MSQGRIGTITSSMRKGTMKSDAKQPPSRAEVADVLRGLIRGSMRRQYASRWASCWVAADDPGIEDDRVWNALECLVMSDIRTVDRAFLYEVIDFRVWLEDLLASDRSHYGSADEEE